MKTLVRVENNKYLANSEKYGFVLLKLRRMGDKDKLIFYKEIMNAYIEKAKIMKFGTSFYYQIMIRDLATNKTLEFNGTKNDVISKLKASYMITNSRILEDYLFRYLSEMAKNGKIEVKEVPPFSGVFEVNGEIRFFKEGIISRVEFPDKVDLNLVNEALDILHRIQQVTYHNNAFSTAMLWSIYAPFGFIIKQYTRKQIYLLLYGERHTFKTTLGRLICDMYPVKETRIFNFDVPEEGGSVSRMGEKLSITTFPLLEDEMRELHPSSELTALLRRATTGSIARWRNDTKEVFYALSSLVLTSNNDETLEDLPLAERTISIKFDKSSHISRLTKEQLHELTVLTSRFRIIGRHLGAFIVKTFLEEWENIKKKLVELNSKESFLQFGRYLWSLIEHRLNRQLEWTMVDIEVEDVTEELEGDERDKFFELLRDIFRTAYQNSFIHESRSTFEITERQLIEWKNNGLLPVWLKIHNHNIEISTSLKTEWKKRYRENIIGGLKGIAKRLGFEYKSSKRFNNRKVMIVPIEIIEREVKSEDSTVAKRSEE